MQRWKVVSGIGLVVCPLLVASVPGVATAADPPVVGENTLLLGVVFLLIVFQEAINGFHDTATAITAVIYSNSLKPSVAVLLAGVSNFVGVLIGGTAVAFAMVSLLPAEMVAHIDTRIEIAFLFATILAAVTWNFGTWFLGIPSSTTHSYIGAILGIAMAHSYVFGRGLLGQVNWDEGEKVLAALLISPVLGFVLAIGAYHALRWLIADPRMYEPSEEGVPPPPYIRGLLIVSAGAASLLHGSNDGQKSIGLLMITVISFAPATYGLNQALSAGEYASLRETLQNVERTAGEQPRHGATATTWTEIERLARDARARIPENGDVSSQSSPHAGARAPLVELQRAVGRLPEDDGVASSRDLTRLRAQLAAVLEGGVPTWIPFLSALALGVGTMVGYRRIVTTLGEQIGGARMNAAHGAAAQLTGALCIGLADATGAPVSTTQVISSGVAGSMVASRAGLKMATLRNILITWITTLPGCILLAFVYGLLFHAWIG